MIKRAFALSYMGMKDLLKAQPELLENHVLISVLNAMDKESSIRVLPSDNARCLTVFYDDLRTDSGRYHPPEVIAQAQQMTVEDADAIVSFLVNHHSRAVEETLYVHCTQGISRSTAIVTFASEIFQIAPDQFGRYDKERMFPNDIQLPLLRERHRNLSS